MDDLIPALRERAADPARRTTAPLHASRLTPAPAALASAVTELAAALRRTVDGIQRGDPLAGVTDLERLEIEPVSGREVRPLPDPADPHALLEVEAGLGVALPTAVRRLYLEIADGGFGPGGGLLPLRDLAAAVQELRSGAVLPRDQAWPESLVPLVRLDPGWICVDVTSGTIVEWDPEGLSERSSTGAFATSFHRTHASVEAWLTEWLTTPTLAEETATAGGELLMMRFGGIEVPVAVGSSTADMAFGREPSGRVGPATSPSVHARKTVQPTTGLGPVPDARAIRRHREKVAARLADDAASATLVVEIGGVAGSLSAAARERLATAARRVSAYRLAWHVPRKSTGAADTAATLALVRFGEPDRRIGTREPWLVARASVVGDALRFTVTVDEIITENESHRWDGAPWRWAGDDHTALADRWGADLETVRPIIAALDGGRWIEALGETVELDDAVAALLAGRDAARDLADLTEVWAPRLAASMARVAPWQLAAATGELRKGKPVRLFGLGGVTQQRKPGIFLSGDAVRPRLSLEFSASNERVRETAWTRPLDLDLVVAGLLEPSAIPG